jgi:large subunit ribosomal protein L35Ae
MEGYVKNYRGGMHTQKSNQMIVIVDGVNSKVEAAKLVGKTVVYTTEAKREIKGKVTTAFGNSGALRVLFEKGMPGQSLAKKVEIK